jgi:hypothetical protein
MKTFQSLNDIYKAAKKPKKEEKEPEEEVSEGQMSLFDGLKKAADEEEDEDEKRDKKLQQRLDEEAAGGEEEYKRMKEEEAEKSFSGLEGMDIVKNMAKVQAEMKSGKSAKEAVQAAYPDYTEEQVEIFVKDMKKGYGVYRAKKEKKMIKSDNENTRLVVSLTKGALEESVSIMRGGPSRADVATALASSIKKGFNIPAEFPEMMLDDLDTCSNVARKSFANACMMTASGYPELQVAGDMVGYLEELTEG